MTTLSPTRMGTRQYHALEALKHSRTGLTAPQLRDELDLSPDSYGTQQTHALLRRLRELEWVEAEQMSEKVAMKNRTGSTGRPPTTRFKITSEGKSALKAAG